jgi:hypothetical protein
LAGKQAVVIGFGLVFAKDGGCLLVVSFFRLLLGRMQIQRKTHKAQNRERQFG